MTYLSRITKPCQVFLLEKNNSNPALEIDVEESVSSTD